MVTLNAVKNWAVIDLLELCDEISKGDNNHPVMKEKQYQIENRSKGNDRANLEWVCSTTDTKEEQKQMADKVLGILKRNFEQAIG